MSEYRQNAEENSEFVIGALSEVRSGKPVEDYEFLEEVIEAHEKQSSPLNDGLANYLANLAISEGGVEDDLIRELDGILDQNSKKGSHSRSRFRNIVQNSEGRKNSKKSMDEEGVNGHRRILGQVEALYEAWDREDEFQQLLEDNGLLSYHTNEELASSSQNPDRLDGGEIKMTVQENVIEIAEAVADTKEMLEDGQYDEEDLDRVTSNLERISRNAGAVAEKYDETEETAEAYRESSQELEAALIAADDVVARASDEIQGAYDDIEDSIEEARETFNEYVEEIDGYLEEIDLSLRGILESDRVEEPDVSDEAQEIVYELLEDTTKMVEFEETMGRLSGDSE